MPSSFRQDWPFLSAPDCPPELKILASDKINTYQQYTSHHQQLFDASTAQDQFSTVRDLVESFIENRIIHREFEYFKEHGHVLGLHPIFKEYAALRQLRRLSPIELFKQKERLEHNIWRTGKKLNDKGQEHLRISRTKSIQQKERQLAEINRLLNL